MRLLLLIGNVYPTPGNNANLIRKITPFLQEKAEVHLLAIADGLDDSQMSSYYWNLPVHWVAKEYKSSLETLYYRMRSHLFDRKGFSDVVYSDRILKQFDIISSEYTFDAVISTSEPYFSAVAASKMRKIKTKILYLMDPPNILIGDPGTRFRNHTIFKVLRAQDAILTTPFIRESLLNSSLADICQSIEPIGFPMIEKKFEENVKENKKIKLLFCGWLYGKIRSPEFFLNIVSRLDERFSVTFMGRECEKLEERFSIITKAEIITLPNQPYEVALKAMKEADIMINIGNSVPVHMPSKTLEYINTGKPFVNFYKMDDCPTLYYSTRYPLCLNISEKSNVEEATERFVEFCLTRKGKTVDRAWIEAEYEECTPKYIAQKILEKLG